MIKILRMISEFFDRQELSLDMMCSNMTYQEYKEELDIINSTYRNE